MKINYAVIYPNVKRQAPNPSDDERMIVGAMEVGCETWKTSAGMRHAMCETLFAGFGNHPGNEHDQMMMEGIEWDSGDPGVNRAHSYWQGAHVRSMSVGDLINIDPAGLNEYWICCSCGFTLLFPEQADAWLNYPRHFGCCGFELNKWLETQL